MTDGVNVTTLHVHTQTSADTVVGVQAGEVVAFEASPTFTQLAAPTGAGIVGYGAGTVADQIAPFGEALVDTGSVAATYLRLVNRTQISILEMGNQGSSFVVGDGSNESTKIQAALNALADSGVELFFPPRTYGAAELTLPSYVSIRGTGGAATGKAILKLVNGANTFLFASSLWASNSAGGNLGNNIRGMELNGNKANNSSGDILILRTFAAVIEDNVIQDAAGNGIKHTSVTANGSNGINDAECVYFRNRIRRNTQRGIYFYDNVTNKVADFFLVENDISDNGSGGYYQVYADRCPGAHILSNQIYDGYVGDVYLDKCGRTIFQGNHMDLKVKAAAALGVYTSLALAQGIEGGVSTVGNFFTLSNYPEEATASYSLIELKVGTSAHNVTGNSFNNSGSFTNLQAIARTAAGAPPGVARGNHFAGFTYAQRGQGWAELSGQGVVALIGGTATVAATKVSADSNIRLTSQADGGTPGWLRVSARTPGTSFTITSSSGTDTSTVGYVVDW